MDTNAKLLDKYGGSVPRYTSYPPATQFRPLSRAGFYRDCLLALPEGEAVSLYLHIPFCRSLCSYCGCMTRVVNDDAPIREYVRMLEKEINLVATTLRHSHKAVHIHFGGGSPNLLLRDDLNLLLTDIRANFDLTQDAEIAMEADPRQLTEEKIHDYARAGINRVSLGVQDFQEATQKAINRIQPLSQIQSCVRWIRDAGIAGLNFDLMYGLPYQTVDTIADNVRKALSLNPDRVALFGYAHVPWMKPHQKILEKHALPDSRERYAQAETARALLQQGGYIPIGMDHFARENDTLLAAYESGVIKRNFQGYTSDTAGALLGFGLSAISRVPDAFIQNTMLFSTYKEKLEKGIFPEERLIHIRPEDRLRGEVIESLMCYFKADCGEICQRHGFSGEYLDRDLRKLDIMRQDGLLELNGRSLSVTAGGAIFIRSIAAVFDAYYEEGVSRHASAV
ncbi:MAG: oxygen-independent coproporphyrinogen III oxidase [Micavibrio sp.]